MTRAAASIQIYELRHQDSMIAADNHDAFET
jgi:hypothetical protein